MKKQNIFFCNFYFLRKKKKRPKKEEEIGRYLLVIPKYWGKHIFSLGSFPEVGRKQKTEKKKKDSQASQLESNERFMMF